MHSPPDSGSESEEAKQQYGACGNSVQNPCGNVHCCHPNKAVRHVQRELEQTGRCKRLDGYFQLSKPDYRTPAEWLQCKHCRANNSVRDMHNTLYQCTKCCNTELPWNLPYSSKDAELRDVVAKEHEIESGKRLIKGRVRRAMDHLLALQECYSAAETLLRETKRLKTKLRQEEEQEAPTQGSV